MIQKNSTIKLFIFFSLIIFTFSCNREENSPINKGNELNFKIAIFSDPHYFDPDLYTQGEAFDLAKRGSRKMYAESEAILKEAIDVVLSGIPDIVLIPGDLTKDGEKSSHQKFAQYIYKLRDAGKKVFVIPGNHDISNPGSNAYYGNDKTAVPSVSPEEFRNIYNDFGYGDAIYSDPNSLTYIAEPIPGMWIIGMDACRYKENTTNHVVGGRFNPNTLNWIKDKLKEGKSKGKLMLGMLHHGILEHFKAQKENPVSSEFVIDDFKLISQEFAELGLNFVFTGHFHANDIVSAKYSDKFIYDIETGSLVTYPIPVRFINITNSKTMDISTKRIDKINFNTDGLDFQTYAYNYLTNDLDSFVQDILVAQFQLEESIAAQLSPVGVRSFISHYEGDEIISKDATDLITKFETSSNITVLIILETIKSLSNDLNPADNNLKINMITGEIIK